MPPKKKKSAKKKKGKKSGGKKSAKSTPQHEQLSELTKEFYLIQIRDLENRLERYVSLPSQSLIYFLRFLISLEKIWDPVSSIINHQSNQY